MGEGKNVWAFVHISCLLAEHRLSVSESTGCDVSGEAPSTPTRRPHTQPPRSLQWNVSPVWGLDRAARPVRTGLSLPHPDEFTLMPKAVWGGRMFCVYYLWVGVVPLSREERLTGSLGPCVHTLARTPRRRASSEFVVRLSWRRGRNGLQLWQIGSVPAVCIRNNAEIREPFYFVFLRGSHFSSFWAQRPSKQVLTQEGKIQVSHLKDQRVSGFFEQS